MTKLEQFALALGLSFCIAMVFVVLMPPWLSIPMSVLVGVVFGQVLASRWRAS